MSLSGVKLKPDMATRGETPMGRTRPGIPIITPEVRAPRQPTAEIQVRRERVIVTVNLLDLDVEDPRINLTPNAVRIGSPSDPRKPEYVILLPVAVNPREYRSGIRNGVLDLVAARWDA